MKKENIGTKQKVYVLYLHKDILKSKHNYGLINLCKLIKVSRGGYRKWILRGCNTEPKHRENRLQIPNH